MQEIFQEIYIGHFW